MTAMYIFHVISWTPMVPLNCCTWRGEGLWMSSLSSADTAWQLSLFLHSIKIKNVIPFCYQQTNCPFQNSSDCVHPGDGGSKVLRNVGILQHYTTSQPRRPGLEISQVPHKRSVSRNSNSSVRQRQQWFLWQCSCWVGSTEILFVMKVI
jgi:hypothetical protein